MAINGGTEWGEIGGPWNADASVESSAESFIPFMVSHSVPEQGETLQVTFQGKRYPLVAKSETVRIY